MAVGLNGRYVYSANSYSNNVSGFQVNSATGALSVLAGSPFPAGSYPHSVAFGGPTCSPDATIALAETALGAPYRSAGKGWDVVALRYVKGSEVVWEGLHQFYAKDLPAYGPGLDCSGLVLWSCNKSAGALKFPYDPITSIPVGYQNADGQYRNNVRRFYDDAELQRGDLVFFDADPPWGIVDHVIIYTGNGQVIESTPGRGVISNDLAFRNFEITLIRWRHGGSGEAFVAYGRLDKPLIRAAVVTHSPISIRVTDPDGNTIGPDTVIETSGETLREVPGVLYYSVGAGEDDQVISPVLKPGEYVIEVLAKDTALPGGTYGLDFVADGIVVTLAHDVPIEAIPPTGYGVRVFTDGSVETFVPVDSKPPDVIPPGDITVQATGPLGTTGAATGALHAFLLAGSATDSVDPSPARLAPQVGGADADDTTLFPVGTTTVTFRFRDASGNVGSGTATVTVALASPVLAARAAGKQVQLNWTNVNAAGYTVYRGTTTGGPYIKLAQVPGTQLLYLDRNLTVGATYYWVVRPLAASMEEGGNSNQVTAKIVGR